MGVIVSGTDRAEEILPAWLCVAGYFSAQVHEVMAPLLQGYKHLMWAVGIHLGSLRLIDLSKPRDSFFLTLDSHNGCSSHLGSYELC